MRLLWLLVLVGLVTFVDRALTWPAFRLGMLDSRISGHVYGLLNAPAWDAERDYLEPILDDCGEDWALVYAEEIDRRPVHIPSHAVRAACKLQYEGPSGHWPFRSNRSGLDWHEGYALEPEERSIPFYARCLDAPKRRVLPGAARINFRRAA